MAQISLENYIKKLQKSNPKYQWPLEDINEKQTKRQKLHEEFPYVVTYCGHYGPERLLDDLQDWCREKFGSRHGECHWKGCEHNWYKWLRESGLEDELDRQLDESDKRNPKPDEDDEEAMDVWYELGSKIIDEHFEMMKTRTDAPKEHSHEGSWTTFFVMKTGYDYGYEDYCFRNQEDAVYFKLMCDEEAEKRS